MKSALLKVSATLALVASLYTAAWGQNLIVVKVIDRNGEAVKDPDVKVENEKTRDLHKESTSVNGILEFTLPPGKYKITASAQNLKAVKKVNVEDGSPHSLVEIKLVDLALTYGPYLVSMSCGALILFLLDVWLRHKGVRDSSLIWLYGSLLTWFVVIAMPLLDAEWLQDIVPVSPEYYKYLLSIVSSLLFVLTAFRLSRVQDWFSEPKRLQMWRGIVLSVVFIISVVSIALQLLRNDHWGPLVDAAASTLAGGALGAGLTYSYYEYGNRLFAWVTAFTFITFICRQWYLAIWGTPTSGFLAPFFLANTTLVIMLFIALAVAWGLSDASRLKTVGITANVEVVALFFDLRGSTPWASEAAEKNFHYVKFFLDDFRDWAWKKALASGQGRPKLVKFLGDGFMYVWEITNESVTDSANAVAELAYDLSSKYSSWVNEARIVRKFSWGVPKALGVGVDVGHAIRLTFESGSEDYLGSPMNIAAKMQNLTRPSGGVVIQEKIWNLLDGIRDKFPKKGQMKLGNSNISVRATENVELNVNQP